MTKDYQGCTQGTFSRDSSGPDDQDPEKRLSGSPDSTQIRKAFGQKGTGRFFYITGIRDSHRPRAVQRIPGVRDIFPEADRKSNHPT